MADVKWIKIVVDIFDNRKIKQIEKLPDGNSLIVIWLKLLCLAGNINDNGLIYITHEIPYTEQTLATQFNSPISTIQLALKTFANFGMIEVINDFLCVSNWEKYQNVAGMDRIREQTRKRVAKHRDMQKISQIEVSENVTLQVTQSNATDKIRIDKNKNNKNNVQSAIELFESLWKLYPNKKGKGQVSETKKKALLNIGYEEMSRAIERYLSELKKEEWRKPQNGSTFFNSGYIDYLDKNFEPSKATPQKKTYDFEQKQDYDFASIEQKLLERK